MLIRRAGNIWSPPTSFAAYVAEQQACRISPFGRHQELISQHHSRDDLWQGSLSFTFLAPLHQYFAQVLLGGHKFMRYHMSHPMLESERARPLVAPARNVTAQGCTSWQTLVTYLWPSSLCSRLIACGRSTCQARTSRSSRCPSL